MKSESPSPKGRISTGDAIIGEVPVVASLDLGSERLRLFLTGRRMIVAHIGKRGAGALATGSLFGKLAAGLEDLLKRGGELLKNRKLERPTVSSILEADPDNFSVGYEDIIRVDVNRSRDTVEIAILTKHDKFLFSTLSSFERVSGLFSKAVGDKLTLRKLAER